MRSAGAWSGAWVDDGSGRVVFKWKAGAKRVPASVQKLVTTAAALDRLGPEARFETAIVAEGRSAEVLDGDLYLRAARATPASAPPPCADWPGRSARPVSKTWAGRIYGDESFFDRRRGALRFRGLTTSGRCRHWPSTTDRCCRWLGDGRAIPPSSWQAGCASRCDQAGRRGSARARPQCACRRDHLATTESPPLEALVRHTNHVSDNYYAETLLKGLGARSGTTGSGGRRRNRVEVRARAGPPRQDRRRLRPLSIQCDLTQRSRPPPAEGR